MNHRIAAAKFHLPPPEDGSLRQAAQAIRKASLLVWGEKRDSEEKCLLNLVTSGGVCPASVLGEEALLTTLKPGPEHQKTLRAKGP